MDNTEEEEMVTCYPCKGTGISPISATLCLCCKGVSNITKKRSDALAQIRRDLSAALLGIRDNYRD